MAFTLKRIVMLRVVPINKIPNNLSERIEIQNVEDYYIWINEYPSIENCQIH